MSHLDLLLLIVDPSQRRCYPDSAIVAGAPQPSRVSFTGAPALVGATYDDRPLLGFDRGAPRMVRFQWQRRILIALFPFVAACGSSLRSKAPP